MIASTARSSNALTARHANIARPAADRVSDAKLIKRIAAGDRLAMQVLYTRHYGQTLRYVRGIVRDSTAAEDIVSDVFLDVWRKADSYEGRCPVSTWLCAIARHKSVDSLRRRSCDPWDDESMTLIEDETDGPEASVQKQDTASIVRQCLGQLSPAHRAIIELVYFHEKTVDEAAKIIGVARNTVKTRAFYARQRLAELLSAQGVTAFA
jgi:RNA polymerase sigma-70 factor (ECF subfamily)